jgi:signal transduction histidine kinase/ActR/RegA family two-component response regulator/PAS domain-containing protein
MKSLRSLLRLSSLQARLGAMLAVLVLGVAVVLAVVMSQAAERQVLRQSASNLDIVSRQLARELAIGMDRFAQAAVTQTSRELFRDPASSAESMRSALNNFVRTNPEFAYASIIDVATGQVLAANGGIFEGGSAIGRPVLEQGQRALFIGDVHDAVRLAELLPKPENGEKLRFLDVSVPILDDAGRVFRVFATHIGWQWTDQVRNDIFGPLKASHGIEALLVDSAGKVVLAASSEMPVGTALNTQAAVSGESAQVMQWPDGGAYLTVSAATTPNGAFPGFGWKVVARQPAALAASAASQLRTAFVLGAILLGCTGALLAWWATGRLLLPVRRLSHSMAPSQYGPDFPAAPNSPVLREVAGVQQVMAQMAQKTRDQTVAREMSERQFATLADSLPQRVFQTDATGHVDYVNRAWMTASADVNSLIHRPLESLFLSEPASVVTKAWHQSLQDTQPMQLRCLLQPVGAPAMRWYDLNAVAVNSVAEGGTAWIGMLIDVHQIVMDAQHAEMALTAERAARAEAEHMGKLRDEFLATVSHELRSPLNVITGWAEILKRKGQDNPTALKAAEVIRVHARQQAGLIDDLIDITAVTAGKMVLNLEPVDLATAASDVVSAQLPAAQLKGVALRCIAPHLCVVQGDRRRVFQVISNLLDNSIKFTDAGGSITVEVKQEATQAVVSICDSGHGIEPHFLPHVFERMRQEDSSKTRRAGGLGLGLSIVQGVVELHRGTVSAASEGRGRGATFSIALPLREPSIGASVPVPVHTAKDDSELNVIELQGYRVLLVDDEADAREMAQVALNSLGANVQVASSGAAVLELLKSQTYDVLVSDIGMPEMDGLMLIREIRKTRSSQDLPAVALTAFAMESDRQTGIHAGFQAYVTKPISLRRLSEALSGVLTRDRAAQQSQRQNT